MATTPKDIAERERHWTAESDGAGTRLDRWLADRCADLSRSRIQGLIADGRVTIQDRPADDAARRVRAGDRIALTVPASQPSHLEAQSMALDIVFEDEHLIVVNKPAGMVVHPGAGNPERTLVNALLAHCGDSLRGIGGVARPGIVHRIDKDTSGLLVAAKTEAAHAHLSAQIARHGVERLYDAFVWGVPRPAKGIVSGMIGRSRHDRKKMTVLTSGGRHSETAFRTVEIFDHVAARIECRLKTGRTHQIRVHMSSIGHGLIGDPVYGAAPARLFKSIDHETVRALRAFPRQALHARVLGFVHPVTGGTMRFERTMPEEMQDLNERLRAIPTPRRRK